MSEKGKKIMKFFATMNLLLYFVLTMLLSILITTIYLSFFEEEYQPRAFRGEENNIFIPLILLAFLITMTIIIYFVSKKGGVNILKIIFYIAVSLTSIYFFLPILALIVPYADIISIILGVILVTIVHYKPEWYVMNIVGIIISSSAATILGMSLSILPIVFLLAVFAIYDFISVYKTKHMLSLADIAVKEKLPLLFVSPKVDKYSYSEESKLETKGERESLLMGFGDAVFPSSLVVSSFVHVGIMQALGAMIGASIGFCVLIYFVEKFGAQPGLPYLNSFGITGMLTSHLLCLLL